jgi:hypothetical protein
MTSRPVRRVLGGALVVLALTGCGTASDPSPPAGVDGLEVPTPSPDPDDFVEVVDNPFLPLPPGSVRSYDVVTDSGPLTRTVTVEADTRDVGGVAATAVRDVLAGPGGRTVSTATGLYAQDTAGNVWLLGRSGAGADWVAGSDGARAGIAMLAKPRVGDGYRQELAPGTAEDRSTVLSTDEQRTVPAGSYDGVVTIETRTSLRPGDAVRGWYAPGAGLVYEEAGSVTALRRSELTGSTGLAG